MLIFSGASLRRAKVHQEDAVQADLSVGMGSAICSECISQNELRQSAISIAIAIELPTREFATPLRSVAFSSTPITFLTSTTPPSMINAIANARCEKGAILE